MRTFVKYSLLATNLTFAALLLSTYFIPKLNPYEFGFLGILGILTPVLVIINCIFIFIWLFARKFLLSAIPLISILITWNVFNVCVGGKFFEKQEFKKDSNSLSIMSYNVRLLNLYQWSKEGNTRAKLIDFLAEKNPTVLCLQEFYTNNDSIGFDNIAAIKKACHYDYVATCNMFVSKRGKWGNIIFSHLPIVESKNYSIDVLGSNLLQKADIVLLDDTISIYNVHLKSNYFNKKESALVNKEKLGSVSDSDLVQSKNILEKLEESAVSRGMESEMIANILSQNKAPSIVCGDLNDLPSSYEYFKVRGNMHDVFLDKGYGFGKTYRNAVPVLRIDYIFYNDDFFANGYEKFNVPYSDHEPILANFSVL